MSVLARNSAAAPGVLPSPPGRGAGGEGPVPDAPMHGPQSLVSGTSSAMVATNSALRPDPHPNPFPGGRGACLVASPELWR